MVVGFFKLSDILAKASFIGANTIDAPMPCPLHNELLVCSCCEESCSTCGSQRVICPVALNTRSSTHSPRKGVVP